MTHPELEPLDEHNQRLQANVSPLDWQNPQPNGRYHLVVIGAGTAGLVAAAGAAGLGAKVAIIERNLMGGDCLNVGCVPSKAIIAASRAAAGVKGNPAMGVTASGEANIDFAAVMERMRRLRADISPNDSFKRFTSLGVDVYQGSAQFIGGNKIQVSGRAGERELSFRRALIATGARAAAPPIPGLEAVEYLTNETLFSLTELPASMAIIGGGPIGCEMAQAFARLGTQVTLFTDEKGPLPNDDPAAGKILQQTFEQEGVTVRTDGKKLLLSPTASTSVPTTATISATKPSGVKITGPDGDIQADRLLIAVGRAPNVKNLGLEKIGIAYDQRHGVQVNDYLQTTNPKVFAAGDICSLAKFTHAADFQARTVIRNALLPWPMNRAKASSLVIPWATYTEPEVAGVGLTEQEAKRQGIKVDSYEQPFSDLDRAILEGQTEGFVKVLTYKGTDRIAGVTIVSPSAGDMIGEATLAVTHKLGLGKVATTVHPYPTLGEALRKLGDQYNRTKLTPFIQTIFRKWFASTR